MYEKIALIVLTLFAVASSEEVSPTRTEVRDADLSDSRLSPMLALPSSYNDQHFTKAKRRPTFLLTPLSQTRSKQRQSKKATQKTKRCGTHLRKSRLSSSSAKQNFAKTRNPNANVHVKTSKNIPYVSARNTKYSSKNSAITRREVQTRDVNKTLLRALQDSLKDAQDSPVNMDSQKEAKRCNKFVCYCQEENCVRKPSKTSSSRILGSSRRIKPGRVNRPRPTGRENTRPILDARVLRPGSPRWYQEADPRILDLINSVPMRPPQEITHPAFFAPLLHGVPLVAPHINGKDGEFINAAFPYASFEDRPDFTVGDNIDYQRRPISQQGMQECRYTPQENRFDVSTVSTTSAWSNINLNEESSTTEFAALQESFTATYLDGLTSPVTESNVELKDVNETTEINPAETFPRLSATLSTDDVASVTKAGMKDFESYSSSGTIGTDSIDEEFPGLVTMPERSYVNAKTDPETRSDLNPYYSETTTMRTTTDQSESTGLFRETMLSWTNRPDIKTENSFDQKTNDFGLTTTEPYEYTKPAPTEFYEYVETTERTYEPNEDYDVRYSDENKLSNINKYIPIEKLTKQTIDEIEESTRGESLGKSKSHTTKMLLSPSYDGESTTENSPAGEKLVYSTTNTIREDSWTSALPYSRTIHEGETTTPYYESTTDRNFNEGTTNILMESITETYPWRVTLGDQLTTAQYSSREKTNEDKGNLKNTNESLVGITKSSAKRLPFCDNSLLLSSIKRVINNFALSGDLTKVQDLDEDALRTQGKSLLPEILQIPNLRDILSAPRIEDTIVAKVKGVLSNVKDNSNFVKDWFDYGMIRKALRRLLDSFRGLHHETELPTTVEEHQFDHGQWRTKLVTLPPVHEENPGPKLSTAAGRLRESIGDLLGIPAVASQADRQVVRNMIVQSLKNNLAKGEGEDDGPEDSVILHTLNDVLQTLKGLKNINAKNTSEGSDVNPKVESVLVPNDEEDENIPRETLTRYENEDDDKTEGIVEESASSGVKQPQKDTPMEGTGIQPTNYQKVEKLDSNLKVLTACNAMDLMKPGKLNEEQAVSLTANPLLEATTISSTDAEAFREGTENISNSMPTTEDVEVQQNNEVRSGESWEDTTNYQRPSTIYEQLAEINRQPPKIHIPEETAGYMTKDAYTTEGTAQDILDETELVGEQYNEIEPWKTTVSMNDNVQTSIGSDPRANGSSETPNEESKTGIETITVQNEATPLILQSSETNTQESTKESSNRALLKEPSEISSSQPEIVSVAEVTKRYDEMTTGFDETTTKIAKQNNLKSFAVDETLDKILAAAVHVPNSMSSSIDDEPQINTTDFYNESNLDGESDDDETTQENATNPMKECFPKYDEMDPTMMRAMNDIDAPPINYYSPNDRILNYVKSHRVENEATTAIVNSMQKASSDYAQLSDEATLNKNTAAATSAKHEMKYALDENVLSPSENIVGDPISSGNDYGNRKAEVTVSSSSADADSLRSQQQEFQTGDVIKIHEVTTEVQKTYTKTVYFQPRQFDPTDESRTNSSTIAYEDMGVASNNNFNRNANDSNDSSDQKIDNVGDVVTEANKNIVSATGLPLEDVDDTFRIFPSSNSFEDSIEQLQRSQLYYINDGVKLPLEIKKLKDGTYALLISKNVCEQILKRKCCVPLQGHVVQSPRPDTRADDIEEDYQLVTQPLSSTTTLRNTLSKLEEQAEEELNVYRLSNYRRKRDLIEDDTMAIVSMPVLDFVRKYNLSLDFDEKEMALNELRSSGKIRNFGDSLKQLAGETEHNQLKDKNRNSYSKVEKSRLQGEKRGEVELQGPMNIQNNDILGENVKSLKEAGLQKSHASQPTKVKTSGLRKLDGEYDDQRSVNVKQITNRSNQARNSISKGTDIFEGKTKFKNNEMKWGDFEILVKKRGEIPEEIKLIKLKKDKENEQQVDNNEENKLNDSEIKILKNMNGRPYRYQRNTNSSPNKGVEVVKEFLYWVKSLFLNTNK